MSDTPKYPQKNKPVPPVRVARPPDVSVLRATTGVDPLATPSILTSPTITRTKSVTTTNDSEGLDLRSLIKPHGKRLIDQLIALAFNESIDPNVQLRVINSLIDRGWGKAATIVTTESIVADITQSHIDELRKLNSKKG